MKKSSSIPGKVYKYVHHRDEHIKTNLTHGEFESEWMELKDGIITIKATNKQGYAWDGCSPKWILIHLIWGTPDGKLDYQTEKPVSYYASLFHDMIYQHKSGMDITRKEADIIFMLILRKSGFMWWWLYYIAVRAGGKFYGKWKNKKRKEKKIVIEEISWG